MRLCGLTRSRARALARQFADEVRRLVDLMAIVHGVRARATLVWGWCALTLQRRLRLPARLRIRLRWRGPGGEPMSAVIADASEIWVLREVFVLGEYDVALTRPPTLVVDLGANIGLSVLYFKARYPDARIVAVEPDAGAFARLQANTAHLDGVTLVRAAVTDHDGEVTLYCGRASWASSTIASPAAVTEATVPAMTLDRLMATTCPADPLDLLKLDIEGSEAAVLASQSARAAGAIVFEFHREHSDDSLSDLLDGLEGEGLRVARILGQADVHPLVTLVR